MRYLPITCLILLLYVSNHAYSQIVYTADFTEMLKREKLTYDKPFGIYLRPELEDEQQAFSFDLELKTDDRKLEVKYLIPHRSKNTPGSTFEFIRTLSNIARNEGPSTLMFEIHEDNFDSKLYRADWVGIADFRPKKNISLKKNGKMIYIDKNDHSPFVILVFYDEYMRDIDRIIESIKYTR